MPDFILWYLLLQALLFAAVIIAIYIKVETLQNKLERPLTEYMDRSFEHVSEATMDEDDNDEFAPNHDLDADLDTDKLASPWGTEPVIEDQRESTPIV